MLPGPHVPRAMPACVLRRPVEEAAAVPAAVVITTNVWETPKDFEPKCGSMRNPEIRK